MGLRSIPLVFGRTSSVPLAEWQPGRTSPFGGLGRGGQRGGGALAFPVSSCVALQGVQYSILEPTSREKASDCTFTPLTFLEEGGENNHICLLYSLAIKED